MNDIISAEKHFFRMIIIFLLDTFPGGCFFHSLHLLTDFSVLGVFVPHFLQIQLNTVCSKLTKTYQLRNEGLETKGNSDLRLD